LIRLRQGQRLHEVLVREGRDGLEVSVDGQASRPVVERLGPGRFALVEGPRRCVFHCVKDGDRLLVLWDGAAHTLLQEREGAAGGHRHHEGVLEAPMPGKVIKLSVAPGAAVRKGDEVLVIEAMKMENAVRAPREGTVKAVACQVGDMVAPGTVLVEIE
jgi:3-methylcrotonyl-CoA carboxylase alpha subunit